jgi:hypothetical protein
VFNLVNGDGPGVGAALSAHPDVDMVSFTGSTRAGVLVAQAAAPTVKRVAQELGGKSANIVLNDADLPKAVKSGVMQMMTNSGQSCNAPSRMFIPRAKNEEAKAIAKATAEAVKVQDPKTAEKGAIGPVVSEAQFNKIQGLIKKGIDEGATLVVGGLGRPDGLNRGYYVRPTVFADVRNDMTIAVEEIFGPVLCMIPYDTERHGLWPLGLCAGRAGARTESRRPVAHRHGAHQRRGLGPDHAIRRLQAVGQWPGMGRGGHPRIPRDKVGVRLRDGLMGRRNAQAGRSHRLTGCGCLRQRA